MLLWCQCSVTVKWCQFSYYRAILEYDAQSFSKIAFLFEWNDFFFIFAGNLLIFVCLSVCYMNTFFVWCYCCLFAGVIIPTQQTTPPPPSLSSNGCVSVDVLSNYSYTTHLWCCYSCVSIGMVSDYSYTITHLHVAIIACLDVVSDYSYTITHRHVAIIAWLWMWVIIPTQLLIYM